MERGRARASAVEDVIAVARELRRESDAWAEELRITRESLAHTFQSAAQVMRGERTGRARRRSRGRAEGPGQAG